MSTKPREMLQRCKVALEVDQPLPRDVARWLSDGLERFSPGGLTGSLCTLLGLRKTTKEQRGKRNKFLCLAGRHVTTHYNPWLSPYERSHRLASLVSEFEKHYWNQYKDDENALEFLRPVMAALFQAKMAIHGAGLPASQHTLYKIIRNQ